MALQQAQLLWHLFNLRTSYCWNGTGEVLTQSVRLFVEVITFDNAEQMLHVIVSSPSRGWQVKGTKAGAEGSWLYWVSKLVVIADHRSGEKENLQRYNRVY